MSSPDSVQARYRVSKNPFTSEKMAERSNDVHERKRDKKSKDKKEKKPQTPEKRRP